MNTKEIKKVMIDRDLTIAQIARQLEPRASETRFRSLQQMLSDLIYGRRWYPTLASRLRQKYGFKLDRPPAFAPKVRLKNAA